MTQRKLLVILLYFNRISGHPDLENYEGIGFVVQAYQKRASYKNAQEQGLEDYPVYTI
ncbi:MAG: hypothetical protein MRQ13_04235 [Candidatus Midichloria sp.]|nr:hypothetical protein [Candidatus Midichloria sp.]